MACPMHNARAMRNHTLPLFAFASLIVFPAAALAQERTERSVSPSAVEVSGYMGANSAGLVMGQALTHRVDWFQYGGFAEVCGLLAPIYGAGLTAGIAVGGKSGVRLNILGTFGHHWSPSWGAEPSILGGGKPGVEGATNFAGTRFGIEYLFGEGPGHFILGLSLLAENDLSRTTQQYQYTETGLFSGDSYTRTASATIGTRYYGGLLQLGGSFEL